MTAECLFGYHSEVQKIAKASGLQRTKYQKMSLEEIQKQLVECLKALTTPPKTQLEEQRAAMQRVSDIYDAWIPCIIITTKDKYLLFIPF